ncbi:leucine-rich repeat-containing protein 46-like isoform X2 [Dreissena polymorpha]|uniref:leucine-rich repeat-containing protein 46-like isoform X2 n=1 Tax=Dreissena polymorpha TaxID=45954 RepID=UPI0022648B25|nr:leucine-rich repeat-containing protein 46-like isoform X2 [Dreissena polymorpha]
MTEEQKPVRLSLHMICKRHLPPDGQKWDQKKIIDALNQITHVRLDRERIGQIDSLELLGDRCTNLYLQSNLIETIENLECLKNLTFIILANNRIRKIENLKFLKKLLFLDLSENQISAVDKGDVPASVIILNLTGNPCTNYPHYRLTTIADFPNLRQLDLCELSNVDKREAGLNVPSDEEDEDDLDDDDEEEEVEVVVEGGVTNNVALSPGDGLDNTETLQGLTAGILLRSAERTEVGMQEHRKRTSELDDLRVTLTLPPSSRLSSRSAIPH